MFNNKVIILMSADNLVFLRNLENDNQERRIYTYSIYLNITIYSN